MNDHSLAKKSSLKIKIKSFGQAIAPPMLGAIIFCILWEDLCRLFETPSYVLPAPSHILAMLSMGSVQELLFNATIQTASAALLGFTLSAVFGVLLGTLLASVRFLRIGVYPLANLLQMVPIIAIAPLLNIWFGYGVVGVAASAMIVSIFPVIANTVDGLRSVDPQLRELFTIYGATPKQRWRLLEIPAALPQIFTGFRIAAGLAVIGAVVGELVSGVLKEPPIGAVIAANLRTGKLEIVFSAVVCSALVGFTLFALVSWLGQNFMVGLSQEQSQREETINVQQSQQERWWLGGFCLALLVLTLFVFFSPKVEDNTQKNKQLVASNPVQVLDDSAKQVRKVRMQLNWVPEPEFGGIYEAKRLGYDREFGIDLEIIAGGPGTPTAQLIAQKKVDFGVVDGTQIVGMRAKGADIVGIYASFQNDPRAFMTHAHHSAQTIEQLWSSSGLMAVEPGSLFMKWLSHKYGKSGLNWVSTSGGLAQFKLDPKLSQSVYVFSEPVTLQLEKVKTRLFPVSESGFNPYAVIVASHGDLIRQDPRLVHAMDKMLRKGWQSYLEHSEDTNKVLSKLNSSMSYEAMELAIKYAGPYIKGKNGELGTMLESRWYNLQQQLNILEVIPDQDSSFATSCFWSRQSSL